MQPLSRPADTGQRRILARSIAVNTGGQGVILALGFVSSIILARLLGPADRGLLGVMTILSTLGVALTGLGLPGAVAYYASLRGAEIKAILGNTLLVGAGIAVVVIPVSWFSLSFIQRSFGHGHGGTAWILAAALVPLTFLDWTTNSQLVAAQRFEAFNLLSVASRVVYVCTIVVLVGLVPLGVTGGLTALAAVSVFMTVGALVLIKPGRPQVDGALLRIMTAYGLRVQAGTLLQITNYRLDVLVVQYLRPLADVGNYVVAQTMAELTTMLALAFQTSIMPAISTEPANARSTTVSGLRHHGLLAIVAIAVNLAFTPLVIHFAFGEAYLPALRPFFILLPGMWFLGQGIVATGILRGSGRPGAASIASGLAALATLGLDLALIPPLGIAGAAIASDVAYALFGILAIAWSIRAVDASWSDLVPQRSDLRVYRGAAGSLLRAVRFRR